MEALTTSGPRIEGWRAWWLAARPRTLTIGLAPVVVGTALAQVKGDARMMPAAAALLAALLIQVGTNFSNDLFDYEKGADGAERIGPPRAMQLGILAAHEMRRGVVLAFAAAGATGVYLVWIGGWPIAIVGLLSIGAGLTYSGGRYAFGYHGLGDAAVFLFFGLIAVCGSYYVQTLSLTTSVVLASLPVGALATAILVVNNIRDIDGDRQAGKHTLAVRLGPRASRLEYTFLMLLPFVMLPCLYRPDAIGYVMLLPLIALPRALALVRTVWRSSDGPTLNAVLVSTAGLGLGYCLLLSLSWLI